MTRVSVLLAVHNGARYLAEAIQSVIEQTYPHWELIVVSDGSTDESFVIADDFARRDARIRAFAIPKRGKNAAYNVGFQQSQGDYLCFFAADDLLPPGSLEERLHPAAGEPGHAYTTCCLETFSDDARYHGIVFPRDVTRPNFSGGSLYFSRDLAHRIFPLPEGQPNEDTWTALHLRAFGTGVHVPKPLYRYRIHAGNSYGYGLSFTEKRARYLQRMHAYQLFYEKYQNDGVPFLVEEVRPFLSALRAASEGSALRVLLVRGLRPASKLVLVMYCSRFLYALRHTFFRALSGSAARS